MTLSPSEQRPAPPRAPRAARDDRWRTGFLLFAAGVLVGGIAVAFNDRGADPTVTAAPMPTSVVHTVYVPETLADTPSEAERVEFEKWCQAFLREWIQVGPISDRRQRLAPFMTPSALEAQMQRGQDRLPKGVPVGPPKLSRVSPRGGLYAAEMTVGAPVQLVVGRHGGQWKIDWIEG